MVCCSTDLSTRKGVQQAMLSICAIIETACLVAHTPMIRLASFSRVIPKPYTVSALHNSKASLNFVVAVLRGLLVSTGD